MRQNRLIFSSKQVVHRVLPLHPDAKNTYLPSSSILGDMADDEVEDARKNNQSSISKLVTYTKLVQKKIDPVKKEVNEKVKAPEKETRNVVVVPEVPVNHPRPSSSSGDSTNQVTEDDLANNPGIQSLMDISLPSLKFGDDSRMVAGTDGAKPLWLEENINDYSFSSLLGHLDAHFVDENRAGSSQEGSDSDPNRDEGIVVENSIIPQRLSDRCSVMSSESSIDYVNKFAELTAERLATHEN